MKDDLRRERTFDAAPSRAAAAAEGAALGVTTGSLMLGAMLSKTAAQQPHQRLPDAGANRPDQDQAPPPEDSAVRAGTTQGALPAAEQGTSADQFVRPLQHVDAAGIGDRAHDVENADTARAAVERADGVISSNGQAAAVQSPPVELSEPAGSASLLRSAAVDVMQPFYELSSNVQSLFEQWTGTTAQLTNTLYEMGDNISDAIADAASALENTVDTITDNFAPVEIVADLAGPIDVPKLDPMSWLDIDEASSSLTAGLDALPSALLGAYSEPKADGVLAQNFGEVQAPAQESPPMPAMEDAGFEAASAIGGPIGFIGVSYIDIVDPQDTAHHSLNSPMHGLI